MPSDATALRGRSLERDRLDDALKHARGGESSVVVLRGEAGIGKTTLLEYVAAQATGCRMVQVAGVASELDLSLAALHQLCAPLLEQLEALPEPQRQALEVAFGHTSGPAPDRFLVGLAVLGLLAEAAGRMPLICLVDDAQWLDEASGQVLAFVARRLLAEPILMMFAVRDPEGESVLTGLPTLAVDGLVGEDAVAVLNAALPGELDEKVRDRIVAETRGNPLALLEFARRGRAELLGGFVLPSAAPNDLQDHYVRRISALPESTRQLLLLAAADPTGDATLLWRAGQSLGLGPEAAAPAEEQQLFELGGSARFRHPLIRSAAYAAGTAEERRVVHGALAGALDGEVEPERRAWHLGSATTGPDEGVAAELVGAAHHAVARGRMSAAAALLNRSAALTDDPHLRAERELSAARAYLDIGAFESALGLLAEAEADADDELQRARVDLIRGLIDRAARSCGEAPVALLRAARRLERLDPRLARRTYLDAWSAALVAGPLALDGGDLMEVSLAAQSAPASAEDAAPGDWLLDGMATMVTRGVTAAESALHRGVTSYLRDVQREDFLHCGVLVGDAALALWDYDAWEAASTRHVEMARSAGAFTQLANALNVYRVVALWAGDVGKARALGFEEETVKELIGVRRASYGDLFLLAYQGNLRDAVPSFSAAALEANSRGEGLGVHFVHRAEALLHLGLGRYAEALAAAESAVASELGPFTGQALPDLIEAAVRTGSIEAANAALTRLASHTAVADSDWAAGLFARSRALVSDGADAERWYLESVVRLQRTKLRFELARAQLVYGEWLRRQGRRVDARAQLREAHDAFVGMEADGFAERTRHELLATGEKVRKRTVDTLNDLTPQEAQIARMARAGRTNSEIGAELYISARTVEWHLRKVYGKLGIASRRELADSEALVAGGDSGLAVRG